MERYEIATVADIEEIEKTPLEERLTGRKKELIIQGGHNIDPLLIEDPLYQLPGVQVAAAVGRPDAHAGEVPLAYVQLQEGSDLTAEKILEHLKKTVGERAAIPKEVILIDEVPLTPVGKIFKPALRWDAIRRVYEKELEAVGGMAESLEIDVSEDKVHGCLATIRVKPAAGTSQQDIENKVESILARYTIRYRVEMA